MVPVNQLAINIIIHFRDKRDYYFIQQHRASRDVINFGRVDFQGLLGMWMLKKQAPQGVANVCKPSDFTCTSSKFKVVYNLKVVISKYCKLKTCPVILKSLACIWIGK